MGILGLLPILQSITERRHIREYQGQTAAIDGYGWLHRAMYSCSEEICLGKATDRYIRYFMDKIDLLCANKVIPYVVFDGDYLPAKASTEEERSRSRDENRRKGIEFKKHHRLAEARKCFIKAAEVTPFMAHCVIQHLKAKNIQYVVAPYEADAQMAYLCREKLVDFIISEDSDCIPFGCRKVLFKFDKSGYGDEIDRSRLQQNKGMTLSSFSDDMILDMCILSGCDYLSSIPGFGLKKAHLMVKRFGSHQKILRRLRFEGKVKVPNGYEQAYDSARLTFRHQRVYDPRQKCLVMLTELQTELLETSFLGPMQTPELAIGVALGDIDPITKLPFRASPSAESVLCPTESPQNALSTEENTADREVAPRKPAPRIHTQPKHLHDKENLELQIQPPQKENAFTRLLRANMQRHDRASSKRKSLKVGTAQVVKRRPQDNLEVQSGTRSHFFPSQSLTQAQAPGPKEEVKDSAPGRTNVFAKFKFSGL